MDASAAATFFHLAGITFLLSLLIVGVTALCLSVCLLLFCNFLSIDMNHEVEEEEYAARNGNPLLPISTAIPRGGGGHSVPGLRPEKLRFLPAFAYKAICGTTAESVEDHCVVCLDQFLEKDQVGRLPPCDHYFHTTCIGRWLRFNTTCPICRSPVNYLEPANAIEPQQVVVMVLPPIAPPSTVLSSA